MLKIRLGESVFTLSEVISRYYSTNRVFIKANLKEDNRLVVMQCCSEVNSGDWFRCLVPIRKTDKIEVKESKAPVGDPEWAQKAHEYLQELKNPTSEQRTNFTLPGSNERMG